MRESICCLMSWWVMISPGLAACSLVSGGARERGSTGVWSLLFSPQMVALSSDVRGHVWVSTLCLPDTWHPAGLAVYCQHYVNHSGTRNTLLLTQNKQLISPRKDYIWWGKNALKVSGWFNNINIEFSLHHKSLVRHYPLMISYQMLNLKIFSTFRLTGHCPQVRISLGLVMKEIFQNSHQFNILSLV